MSTAITAGVTRYMAANAATLRVKAWSVSRFSRSPMCWLIQPWRSAARQKVAFSSPPTASVGATATGSATGSGA